MSEPDKEISDGTERLRVEIEIPDEVPIPLNHEFPVRVSLVNDGPDSLVVNRRLAPGYRDMLAREVFVDLVDVESGQPAPIDRVDYDRNFSPEADYVRLAPGERISDMFDLFEWYPIREPGHYRLTVYYQADESLANPPDDVVHGTYTSPPVEITVSAPVDR